MIKMNSNRRLIICSEDYAGLIGAAIVGKFLKAVSGLDRSEMMFVTTSPAKLNQVTVDDDIKDIYVINVAVNAKHPEIALEFVKKHSPKIALWVDNHPGAEILTNLLDNQLLAHSKAFSSAQLLKMTGYTVPAEWLEAANSFANPRTCKLNMMAIRFSQALKMAMIDKFDADPSALIKAQDSIIEELLTNISSATLDRYSARYELELATA